MRRILTLLLIVLVYTSVLPLWAADGPVKDWTVLVYLNADNNLDPFGLKDVREMEAIGSSDRRNVVVLIDREQGGAKTLYVKKGGSTVIEDHGEIDMGDWRTLAEFGRMAVRDFPSRQLALVIWNHGSGWRQRGPTWERGISYDDSSGNHINTPALGRALAAIAEARGGPIDLLGMDACLMQMAEVCWEVRQHARIVVASEETEPGNGWPYKGVLKPLAADPALSAAAFARAIVLAYRNSYLAWSPLYSTTQSAVDTAHLVPAMEALDALGRLLERKVMDVEIRSAILDRVLPEVQRFYLTDNADLVDFCVRLRGAVRDPEIDRQALACQRALTREGEGAILISRTTGKGMGGADGLAIYLPQGRMHPSYRQLAFAGNGWLRFLQAIGK